MRRPTIAFLFLGGAHQVLHIAPVAIELVASGLADVRLLAAGEAERSALNALWRMSQLADPEVEILPQPWWGRALAWGYPRLANSKLFKVIAARRAISSFDAVVAAERTCTILKRLPGIKPYLIHIPHGGGDRAKGFESRIGLFDHVIVAGEKDRNRLIAENVCRAVDVSVSGYVKLAAIKKYRSPSITISSLANPKPIVLYNPHFDLSLGSWRTFSEPLMTAFANQQEFFLIVAPHVRMFEAASSEERHAVEAQAIPGRILVDLGSARSNDMTYTLAADVYIGDVSSQVYEYLQTPKPCVFLNVGTGAWQENPSFAFWHLGQVISDPRAVLPAVSRASKLQEHFASRQILAREKALGPIEPNPITVAAKVIMDLAIARSVSLR